MPIHPCTYSNTPHRIESELLNDNEVELIKKNHKYMRAIVRLNSRVKDLESKVVDDEANMEKMRQDQDNHVADISEHVGQGVVWCGILPHMYMAYSYYLMLSVDYKVQCNR